MSGRMWNQSINTQQARPVYLPVTVLPQGTGTPLLGEGDPKGSYFTVARTGVGTITLTTKDIFVALVKLDPSLCMATPSATTIASAGIVQNANGTWTITILTTVGGTATDLAANPYTRVFIDVVFRDSTVTP
jgi:hypothetical protein